MRAIRDGDHGRRTHRPRASQPGRLRRQAAAIAIAILPWLLVAPAIAAAAGPPFPERAQGQHVFDTAGVLSDTTRSNAESLATQLLVAAGADVAVFTQHRDAADVSASTARADAEALADQWGVDIAIMLDAAPDGSAAQVGLAAGKGAASFLDTDGLATITDEAQRLVATGQPDAAISVALARVMVDVLGAAPGGETPPAVPAPGPPFPSPVQGQAVYDFAGILSPEAIVNAEAVIDAIEARTGAEVAVYTEPVDYGVTSEETESRALALINQWGIGRKGFDDGMVIFFDIDPSGEHGQVQLYAAPGFEATYLTNSERQSIYENDMLPLLRSGDFDGALAAALRKIDAAATPENAARLQTGRQVNAVLGLVGAPIIFFGLAGWGFFNWRRYGKDPVYLDDPSILMPAPPPDLTAASGAFVMEGGSSRRALTTAMLDLASRGLISFREESGLLGLSHKVGVDTEPPTGTDVEEAHRRLNARRPTGPAEAVALQELRRIDGGEHYIEPDDLPKFGSSVGTFDAALESHVVARGWMTDKPSAVKTRWVAKALLPIVLGGIALFIGITVPISGLVMLGGAALAGGVVLIVLANWMPAVTMAGAMIRAMLAAYRRTLEKTMEQARSMQQVVDEAGLDWLVTPDQAVVWGTALGLQARIEEVLKRSLEDVESGRVAPGTTWFPGWYTNSSGTSVAGAVAAGSGGSIFSGSAVPDLGGMMSALGTIGDSPSSSGGGGGGFSGGGGGGGGGGAGGGF